MSFMERYADVRKRLGVALRKRRRRHSVYVERPEPDPVVIVSYESSVKVEGQ